YQRRATWRVRVPVERFQAFVSAVCLLGEVRQNHIGSQDVTEEVVDVEARIRNKRGEEKRLLKHLADSTGKLEDILASEREIPGARGEPKKMEGRLRFLKKKTALSTIPIGPREWKASNPPVAATFPVGGGPPFVPSYENLAALGKFVPLFLAALVPG